MYEHQKSAGDATREKGYYWVLPEGGMWAVFYWRGDRWGYNDYTEINDYIKISYVDERPLFYDHEYERNLEAQARRESDIDIALPKNIFWNHSGANKHIGFVLEDETIQFDLDYIKQMGGLDSILKQLSGAFIG